MIFTKQHNQRASTLWAVALVIVFFPLFQGTAPGLVLCLGMDGHMEVENSRNGSCCSSTETPLREHFLSSSLTPETADDHCGHCIDIPITRNGFDLRRCQSHRFSLPVLLPAHSTLFLQQPFLDTFCEKRIPAKPSPGTTVLAHFRTISLLI